MLSDNRHEINHPRALMTPKQPGHQGLDTVKGVHVLTGNVSASFEGTCYVPEHIQYDINNI